MYIVETLELELLWLQCINDGDGLVRPKISYELRDNLEIHGGIDIFYGDKIIGYFLIIIVYAGKNSTILPVFQTSGHLVPLF